MQPTQAVEFSQLVDIGGYSLFMDCRGNQLPTVILDSGLGVDSSTWIQVQDELSAEVRVCRYDRAGLGRSDPGPLPRSSQQIVTELHTLLANASIPGPFILVGASFGGLNVQLYASQYPDEILGMVLVDSTHPDLDKRIEALLTPEQAQERRMELNNNRENIRYEDLLISDEQVRNAIIKPEMPIIVIRHGLPFEATPDWPEKEIENLWAELQEDLAKTSLHGKVVVAEKSHHRIAETEPTLVAEQISDVAKKFKSGIRPITLPTIALQATAASSRQELTSERTLAKILLNAPPGKIAIGDTFVWVTINDGSVIRVDPVTNQIVGEPIVFGPPTEDFYNISADSQAVWIVVADALKRVDPHSGQIVATIPLPHGLDNMNVVSTLDTVWLAGAGEKGNEVIQIDPETNLVVGQPIMSGNSLVSDIMYDGNLIWTLNPEQSSLLRINPGNVMDTQVITLPFPMDAITYGAGSIWITDGNTNTVNRLNPGCECVIGEPILVGPPVGWMAANDQMVWVAPTTNSALYRTGEDRLVRIDPNSNTVTETLQIGGQPIYPAVGFDSLWITVQNPNMLLRIAP